MDERMSMDSRVSIMQIGTIESACVAGSACIPWMICIYSMDDRNRMNCMHTLHGIQHGLHAYLDTVTTGDRTMGPQVTVPYRSPLHFLPACHHPFPPLSLQP